METIKLMPFVVLAMFAAVLIYGASRRRGPELQQILASADRDQRLADLTRRLAERPVTVWSVRLHGISQWVRMDVGDAVVGIRCFWPPDKPIEQLVAVNFRDDVGWVLDVDGPAGRERLYGWLLDVRAGPGSVPPRR